MNFDKNSNPNGEFSPGIFGRIKSSIRTKFIITGFVLTIISASFFGWFTIQHEKKALKIELDERANSLAGNLAENSIYGILTLNKRELNRLAENILSQKDIVFVRIEDSMGVILVEIGKETGNESVEEFSSPVVVARGSDKIEEEIILDFEEKLEKKQIGNVKIKISLESLYKKISVLKKTVVLVILGIFVFLTIAITLIVNKFITYPIKNLISATKKIALGDLNYRININYEDELGDLAVFFNRMTEDLKKSKEKIEEYSRTLEEKVDERTRKLKESHEKLIQSDKMAAVGQLAGGVAHEINNPMGVILGFSQSVVKMIKEDNPLYMPLKSIEREAVRCKKLISDLLTFSRTGKTTAEITDINKMIEETLSLVEAQTKVKNIEIIREYGGNLPQTMANKNQLQQVIMNLCNNAMDAMSGESAAAVRTMPEGKKITITTRCHAERSEASRDSSLPACRQAGAQNDKNAFVEIKISDTGTGMSEEVKNHIFEPFFTTKEVGKGTGLGLSLCYEIIRKHKGTIEVESEVEKGTTFIIELPVEREL